jgi:uncharacterized membrane protein
VVEVLAVIIMDTSKIGRIFYGVSIAVMGLLTMYYRDFSYFMLPPNHHWISDHAIWVYLSGAFLFVAGIAIAFGKKRVKTSLILGLVLLFVFCFYFVPYELMVAGNYTHFGAWENAAKVLALAGGAFVLAGRVGRLGAVLFGLTIISFGIDHFLYAKEAQDYIPGWIPHHLFWMYPTGAALLASGIAIVAKIRVRLFATLLGSMIFIWVLILHLPKSIAEHLGNGGGEVVSGFLALAYCGTAFVIAMSWNSDVVRHGL